MFHCAITFISHYLAAALVSLHAAADRHLLIFSLLASFRPASTPTPLRR